MDTKLLHPQRTAQALDPRPSGRSKGQTANPAAQAPAPRPARPRTWRGLRPGSLVGFGQRAGHTWRGRTGRGRTWRSALPSPGTPRSARGPADDGTCRPTHPTYPGVINLVRSLNLNVQGGPHFDYSAEGATSCRA